MNLQKSIREKRLELLVKTVKLSHTFDKMKGILRNLKWDVMNHLAHSPDLASNEY